MAAPADCGPTSMALHTQVRIEAGDSVGRSYANKVALQEGIGEARKQLRDKTFAPDWGEDGPLVLANTLAKVHLRRASRESVREYFHNTWALTDTLFDALKDDSVFYMKPDNLRRPLIFYFAHPATLYINKLHLTGVVDNVDPFLQKLFETGVDEMSWDDMDDLQNDNFPWPTVAVAQDFRNKCKAVIESVIDTMPSPDEVEVTMSSPYWALFMGFEHEHIHFETSSVLMRQLPLSAVKRPATWKYASSSASEPAAAPVNELVAVDAGLATIGKPEDFPTFGWDNEYGRRDVDVPAFKASKFVVSNGEFLPFVLAHGYEEKRWWVSPTGDDEGWRWVTYRNAKHPSFWVATADMPEFHGGTPGKPYQKDDGAECAGTGKSFRLRVMYNIIDMPWDWPVEVNYHEARAFLNWKGANEGKAYRMPTEAEYLRCRAEPSPFTTPGLDDSAYDPMLSEPIGNVNLKYGSSCPVNEFPPSPAGFYDVHGNVWEWAEDHFAPLPGFEIHYMYDDFSAPCFDGWHTVILGGSWASLGQLACNFARYHFRRHFFQHLGFRYVEVSAPEAFPGCTTAANLWEGVGTVSSDLTSSYAPVEDKFPYSRDVVSVDTGMQYTTRLAERCLEAYVRAGAPVPANEARVLHLGCGVGGVSYALAKHFGLVAGVDPSEPLIRHARVVQHHGQLEYERVREGILTDTAFIKLESVAQRSRVKYFISEYDALACEVTETGPFDLVVVDCVLERMTQPLSLISKLGSYVKEGGVVVVFSGNDWTPAATPRNSWLGGFKMNGEEMSTLMMLRYNLKKWFKFLDVQDVAKLVRLHHRKYDLTVLETSSWRRVTPAPAAAAAAATTE